MKGAVTYTMKGVDQSTLRMARTMRRTTMVTRAECKSKQQNLKFEIAHQPEATSHGNDGNDEKGCNREKG